MATASTHLRTDWTHATLATFIVSPSARPEWGIEDDIVRVEEYRADHATIVRADLPGIDPERDVQVRVTDGVLRIDAQRRRREVPGQPYHLRREVRYGFSSRSLPLPPGSSSELTWSYSDGVLEVTIPLLPAA